jgi:hypothetical protein
MTESNWNPAVGRVAEDLIASEPLAEPDLRRLVASAQRTLSRCNPPDTKTPVPAAHLVVGEIQSGKTLAFTTLMALARDNGFRLVIVLAGTKTNLLDQTIVRLKKDLLAGTGALNPWRVWDSPDASVAVDIARELETRRDPNAPIDASRTAVLFVLKNGPRLKKLRGALEVIGASTMSRTPALIIDDEADQASLNRLHQEGESSAVYDSIGRLRKMLPRHDLLMYTATPQGPLLVELADALSPETVTVLKSGPDYIGGAELFIRHRDDYLRLIPDAEIRAARGSDSPPPSLRKAIATFMLALVIAQDRREPRPLSMLVHPAASREMHRQYAVWTRRIRDDLSDRLADRDDVNFAATVASDLQGPYEDLRRTVDDLLPLEVLAPLIPPYAHQVEIREVNAGSEPMEPWGEYPGWILVGGNKLERGYTIKNLAVTYMPRGPGAKAIDTIQQRGRFFGYSRNYLDLCRGWFSAEIADIYEKSVGHEDALRSALTLVDQSHLPLRAWRRELLLSPSLRPTRREVVSLETDRYTLTSGDGWFRQSRLFDHQAAEANSGLARRLFERYRDEAAPDPLDRRRARRHATAEVPLRSLYEVLAEWEAVGEDAFQLLGVSLVIAELLDGDSEARARLSFMDGGQSLEDPDARRRRTREQTEGPARTVEIFQGRDPDNEYPGDRAIRDDRLICVQLHVIDLYERDKKRWDRGVPAIAVHLPGDTPNLIIQR